MSNIRPAALLLNIELDGGYKVISPYLANETNTDGQQSFCYMVEKSGKQFFLKALDISFQEGGINLAQEIERGLRAYNFETALLHLARNNGLSRVVRIEASGQYGFPIGEIKLPVFYLIFECADDNLRRVLADPTRATPAIKLRALHNIAVGLSQLHRHDIAHQDMKPSNILSYGGHVHLTEFKISDLGRASRAGVPSDHDSLIAPGDMRYITIEQHFGVALDDFAFRRIACDIYLLGALVVLMFAQVSFTQRILQGLPDDLRKPKWGGTYDEVLPYVRQVFDIALLEISTAWPYQKEEPKVGQELTSMIRFLCDPDPYHRGHPRAIARKTPFELEFVISALDRLAKLVDHLDGEAKKAK